MVARQARSRIVPVSVIAPTFYQRNEPRTVRLTVLLRRPAGGPRRPVLPTSVTVAIL
jgi:hypothetical protein